jgi:hypothetical protein
MIFISLILHIIFTTLHFDHYVISIIHHDCPFIPNGLITFDGYFPIIGYLYH